jgi:hemolysin III
MTSLAARSAVGPAARPRLRGLLHAAGAPVAVVLGVVLVLLANSLRERTGVAVYAASLTGLFTVSAVYHRGRWRPAVKRWLQRVDHSMIFLLIAGTYTPFCLLVLAGSTSWIVLSIVWGGAIIGIVARLTWASAPRWFFVPLYLGLGWVAAAVAPALAAGASTTANLLLVLGGVLYSVGAVVFATRRPDPAPEVFGFHEVFHALTVAAAACHAAALTLVLVQG